MLPLVQVYLPHFRPTPVTGAVQVVLGHVLKNVTENVVFGVVPVTLTVMYDCLVTSIFVIAGLRWVVPVIMVIVTKQAVAFVRTWGKFVPVPAIRLVALQVSLQANL